MIVRPLKDSDIPILREMFERSGFDYQFPDLRSPLIEAVNVAVDENDQPIGAVVAERIVQLYLFLGEAHPAAKLRTIRTLDAVTATSLSKLGYTEANAFLPPSIADRFGRRLERGFAWVRNWPSWVKRF